MSFFPRFVGSSIGALDKSTCLLREMKAVFKPLLLAYRVPWDSLHIRFLRKDTI